MGWIAIEELDNALQDVKELLLPFESSKWLRFALIIFFLGGSSLITVPLNLPMDAGNAESSIGSALEPGGQQLTAAFSSSSSVSLVFGGILGFLFIFSYLSSVFEFVMYSSLNNMKPGISSNFSKYYFDGLKFLFFRLLMIAIFGLSLGFLILSFGLNPLAGIGIMIALVPVWTFTWLLTFIVKNMALPDIIINNSGFTEAVRKSVRESRSQWRQIVVFMLAKLGIGIAVSLISGAVILLSLFVLSLPLAIIGILIGFLNPILIAIPLIVGLTGLIVVSLLVAVPIKCFVYTWVLRVYSGIEME